jgi:hypothetical protein
LRRKRSQYIGRIGLCLLMMAIGIALMRLALYPLAQPLVFISTRSELLTNQTGIQHYQQSVPISNIILWLTIWVIYLGIMLLLTPKVIR